MSLSELSPEELTLRLTLVTAVSNATPKSVLRRALISAYYYLNCVRLPTLASGIEKEFDRQNKHRNTRWVPPRALIYDSYRCLQSREHGQGFRNLGALQTNLVLICCWLLDPADIGPLMELDNLTPDLE